MNWQRRVQKFVSENIVQDWRYKLAALGAAFVIWMYVAGQQTVQALYAAPVFFENVPVGLVLVNQNRPEIGVTVSGPRDRVLAIKDRQISVSLDLSRMKAGRNDYRFSKEDITAPKEIEVKAFSPSHIIIHLAPETKPR